MTMIKLIVGLGNPGPRYASTRHNAGAWFIEELATQQRLSLRLDKKFQMEWAEYPSANHKIFIAKPITFMNESGIAVAAFAQFYQIDPSEILVVHDELDFQAGEVKLKSGGGHGGHNGLRDILARMGAADFYRLRVGIGHPGQAAQVVSYVLHPPTLDEKIEIDRAIYRATKVLPDLLAGEIAKAMKDLHTEA
jgi:PTH1 family peptidyl-tRNA hydrolase